jgi:hypothetical protein
MSSVGARTVLLLLAWESRTTGSLPVVGSRLAQGLLSARFPP